MRDKRALGDLIPSRTIGDIKTKRKCPGAVIAVPEVESHELGYGQDCALVLASDGLWDELKNQKVMDLLHKHYHPHRCQHTPLALTPSPPSPFLCIGAFPLWLHLTSHSHLRTCFYASLCFLGGLQGWIRREADGW